MDGWVCMGGWVCMQACVTECVPDPSVYGSVPHVSDVDDCMKLYTCI